MKRGMAGSDGDARRKKVRMSIAPHAPFVSLVFHSFKAATPPTDTMKLFLALSLALLALCTPRVQVSRPSALPRRPFWLAGLPWVVKPEVLGGQGGCPSVGAGAELSLRRVLLEGWPCLLLQLVEAGSGELYQWTAQGRAGSAARRQLPKYRQWALAAAVPPLLAKYHH